MSNFIDDLNLVGFWPLNEPSGAPLWKNYSPIYGNHPSGISFDFNVHVADVNVDDDTSAGVWPGREDIVNVSGVSIQGLKLQGQNRRIDNTSSAPFAKMLVVGNGSRAVRVQTLGPDVANSGFTAGLWVYPMSDGWIDAADDLNGFSTASDSWFTGYGRIHNLMGQFHDDTGWYIGVSGQLSGATPNGQGKFGGPHELAGYLLCDVNAGIPLELDAPIEANRYTHLTMTYTYIDGNNNEIAFYKDGVLAANGTTNRDITFGSNNGPRDASLNLGGSTDGTHTDNVFRFSSGWGHLVSGAYHFNRVLTGAEILEMHQCGGMQPDHSKIGQTKEVVLTDPHLLSYISCRAPGWIDSSKNNYNLSCRSEPGERGAFTWAPGPFNSNRGFMDGNNEDIALFCPSGATYGITDAANGFTVCGYFQPLALSNSREQSMMMSLGAVSTATTGPATPATAPENSLGIMLTYFSQTGFGNSITLEVFPVGDGTDGAIQLRATGGQTYSYINSHYGIVYDNSTNGISLYVDGHEAASGTLSHDLQPHLSRLAGSGYPLMFANGITDGIEDNASKGIHNNGGDGGSSGPFALFSRPLGAAEMRAIAQSGINTDVNNLTRQDPRLVGYWPCDDFDLGDVVVEDKARAMSPILGHLTRGDTDFNWDRVYSDAFDAYKDDGTSIHDLFTGSERNNPVLASFGNLGITSGIFSHHGGSKLGGNLAANDDSANTPFNTNLRWMPATTPRNLTPQNINEYIISFEVTPSGNIPSIDYGAHANTGVEYWTNSKLHVHGNMGDTGAFDGEVTSFLTTIDTGSGSGVSICFVGKDGTGTNGSNIFPIISGTLPYGVPSKVLLHAKFDQPYSVDAGGTDMTVALWVDGNRVNQRTEPCDNFRLWSDQTIDNSTGDWILQFGGYATTDSSIINIAEDGGLGEIYMREIFLMRGTFMPGEIESLAANGIQNTLIAGYVSELPKTQVTINDSNLQGYWRFNGFDGNVGEMVQSPGGSGTTDLSIKNNHLDAIAQRGYEQGLDVRTAPSMRAIAGPHRNSDIGIQCSGMHHNGTQPGTASVNALPPYAVSGVAFDNPAAGFSVGFLVSRRGLVASNEFDCLMCYGTLSTTTSNGNVDETNLDPNRSWAIGYDENEQLRMIMSVGGRMYLEGDSTASSSGQVQCGLTRVTNLLSDLRSLNNYQQGDFNMPGADYWDHLCWTYDAIDKTLRCYLNGVLVDQVTLGQETISPWTGLPIAPHTPVEPDTRMITFRSHQASSTTQGAWDFRNRELTDMTSVLTDVFYFSDTLTEEEVRYIAFNGIDLAVGVPASGLTGGFLRGQETGSGIIGGYTRALDSGSGIIGGYLAGSSQASGIIGGYVSGVVFGDGTMGGWVQGLDFVSGITAGYIVGVELGSGSIAGYIRGQDVGSGYFGGLMLSSDVGSGMFGGYMSSSAVSSGAIGGFTIGGLEGQFQFDSGFTIEVIAAQDFDAQLEIVKTVQSDFDAKVIIFQDEQPPLVDIVTPSATVTGMTPPFDQYFVAKASGLQGKTITSTRWTFGDLTSSETVAASGEYCYPVSHRYNGSGFFTAKFEAIDSDGLHASATRIINVTQGIDPVIISLSGTPRSGSAELIVDFSTTIDVLPEGVSIAAQLLNFDDGQSTAAFNPTHNFTELGTYKCVWYVRDSRGVIWSDSLESGSDYLNNI